MILNLKFAETHSTVFIAGRNLQTKLDCTKNKSLFLQYDDKKEMLYVWIEQNLGMIPKESVACMIPLSVIDTGLKHPMLDIVQQPPAQAAQPNLNIQAQVSTPHSHVFAETPGQTGLGQRIK